MAASGDKEKKQVMDVAKPGSTGADPTTRPIIVGHGGMMKDPMVTAKPTEEPSEIEKPTEPELAQKSESTEEAEGPIKPATLPSHKVIQPVSAAATHSENAESKADSDKQDTSSESAPQSSDEAVVDAVIDQVGGKKKDGHLSEEDKKQQELVEKLIADKTYFVPISDTRTKRNGKIIAILFAVLVAALIGFAAAVDAEVINPGFKLPFNFIKGKTSEPAPQAAAVPVVAAPAPPKVTQFNNQQLGVAFSYPESWGAAVVTDNTKETTESSKRATISFTQEPKILVGMKTSVWKDSSKAVQRVCVQPGFTAYKAEKTDLDLGIRVVSDKTNSQVYERLDGGLCSDVTMVGNVKFAKNTGYVGLSVVYQAKVTDTFDLAQRIADYKKDYNKYFSETLRSQMIAVTDSVTEL